MSLQRGSRRSKSSSFFFLRTEGAMEPSFERLSTYSASAATPLHAMHLSWRPLMARARTDFSAQYPDIPLSPEPPHTLRMRLGLIVLLPEVPIISSECKNLPTISLLCFSIIDSQLQKKEEAAKHKTGGGRCERRGGGPVRPKQDGQEWICGHDHAEAFGEGSVPNSDVVCERLHVFAAAKALEEILDLLRGNSVGEEFEMIIRKRLHVEMMLTVTVTTWRRGIKFQENITTTNER